jgi:hypothetical protein
VIPGHIGSQEKYRVNLLNPGPINSGVVVFGLIVVPGGEGEDPTFESEGDVAATIKINLDGLYKRPVS